MKIGIITPYDAANYGAYLQAYANKKFLEMQGHEVYIIKWRSEDERKLNFFPKTTNWKYKIRLLQSRRYTKKVYDIMTEALSDFQIVDYDDAQDIELFVLGSDEIWNVTVPEFQNLIFYGKNKYGTKSIAYAPSISNAEIKAFDAYKDIKEYIKNVDIVGVRDSRTLELVTSIKGKEPNMVCDPTLLLDLKQYDLPLKRLIEKKYLLVYSYYVSPLYKKYLRMYANTHGLKLVSACLYQKWCDINIVVSPMEFISLIRDAECVFTTTFHGSIFTLLNHKRSVIPTKMKKVKDLLEWTGMDKEVGIGEDIEYKDFCDVISHSPNYSEFEDKVGKRRVCSQKMYIECLDRVQDNE